MSGTDNKIGRELVYFMFITLLLMVCTRQASAGLPQRHPPVIIGYEQSPPWSSGSKDEAPKGLALDLYRLAMGQLDRDVRFKKVSTVRRADQLRRGIVDLILTTDISVARPGSRISCSNALGTTAINIYSHPNSHKRPGVGDLVAVPNSFITQLRPLLPEGPEYHNVRRDNYPTLIKKKRYGYFVDDQLRIDPVLKAEGIQTQSVLLTHFSYHLCIRDRVADSELVLKTLEVLFQTYRTTPEGREVYMSYGINPDTLLPLPEG